MQLVRSEAPNKLWAPALEQIAFVAPLPLMPSTQQHHGAEANLVGRGTPGGGGAHWEGQTWKDTAEAAHPEVFPRCRHQTKI